MEAKRHIENQLTTLQGGIIGEVGLRAVLDALLDIEIIYGHALKGVVRDFRNGWFIEAEINRTHQLNTGLQIMIAWIYRHDAVPEALRTSIHDSRQGVSSLRIMASKGPTARRQCDGEARLERLQSFFASTPPCHLAPQQH